MDTRTILTSQPVLSCDVCARRLLRGEHAEAFLQAGQRRTVCELCAPRAADEGWLREREVAPDTYAEPRQRPARNLLARLRRGVGDADESRPAAAEPQHAAPLEGPSAGARSPSRQAAAGQQGALEPRAEQAELNGPSVLPTANRLEAAVHAFNASEFPRRVRGVARSLGQPEASIRPAEHLESAVRIVVAWEICWYRYEIDFSEDEPCVRTLAQGTELSQLEREERLSNAQLSPEGCLALAVAV